MADRPGHRRHRAKLTAREALLFEAGVKLGGIFHQYLGIPIAAKTSRALARVIEEAVKLQPFVEDIRVRLEVARGGPVGRGRFGYRYLVAEMLDARVTVRDHDERVVARLSYRPDLKYALMQVEAVTSRSAQPRMRGSRRRRK